MKNKLGIAALILGSAMTILSPSIATAADRDDFRHGQRISVHERQEQRERERREHERWERERAERVRSYNTYGSNSRDNGYFSQTDLNYDSFAGGRR